MSANAFSETKLKNVVATILNVEPSVLNENSSQDNIPGWDSLKHMNLILALEEEFGVTVPDEDAANLTSYKLIDLVVRDLVEKRG
jgi:acyl carrier protein